MDTSAAPLTAQQVDKIENRMIALLAEPMTVPQRERMRDDLVAGFRALNAMGVQPADQGEWVFAVGALEPIWLARRPPARTQSPEVQASSD